jgi:formylglycine-generating enzyme required for sulfatase activity
VKIDPAVEMLAALGHNTPNLAGAGVAVPAAGTGGGKAEPPKSAARAPIAGETRVNAKDGLTYVWIPAGSFTMGCSPGDTECYSDEKPAHSEQIANGFWLGQTEVTQAAWKKVNGGDDPSHFKGDQLPVEQVDWNQASAYCKAVGGRLPTEKEWEYAARAGTAGARYGSLDAIAWYDGNSGPTTHPVALKQPNAFGLYDILGNVWEWTADSYDNSMKVVRGGARGLRARYARASCRNGYSSREKSPYVGFRCVGEAP